MYKVETWVLKEAVKLLDDFNKHVVTTDNTKARTKLLLKSQKLSKVIKDNYTDVQS